MTTRTGQLGLESYDWGIRDGTDRQDSQNTTARKRPKDMRAGGERVLEKNSRTAQSEYESKERIETGWLGSTVLGQEGSCRTAEKTIGRAVVAAKPGHEGRDWTARTGQLRQVSLDKSARQVSEVRST